MIWPEERSVAERLVEALDPGRPPCCRIARRYDAAQRLRAIQWLHHCRISLAIKGNDLSNRHNGVSLDDGEVVDAIAFYLGLWRFPPD